MDESRILRLPLLRVLIPLAIGIWIQSRVHLPAGWCALMLLPGWGGCLGWLLARSGRRLPSPADPSFALLLFPVCLSAGMLLNIAPDLPGRPEGCWLARVCTTVEPRPFVPRQNQAVTLRCQVDRIHAFQQGSWIPLRGKALLSLQRSAANARADLPHPEGSTASVTGSAMESLWRDGGSTPVPRPGQWLLFRAGLRDWGIPLNPYQFDYGRFQRGRGILYQAWVPGGHWRLTNLPATRGLRMHSLLLREVLLSRLDAHVQDPEAFAILGALLLGYREGMEADTRDAFARSGVMHILAVSGLHVGILYLLPSMLIRRFRGRGIRSWIAWGTVLLLLWGYAFLTGLSASVVRAVAMCSLHRIARLLGRPVPALHILSLAALIMILARPALLLEAGFQLSFAAVAGILLFYSRIDRRLHMVFPGRAGKPLRGMLAVSLAAQLATAPLAIHYFHQYSFGALLANLLVIPLASLMLYGGILFFCGSGSAWLSHALGSMLEATARLLRGIIGPIAELPGVFISGISLHPLQVVLLYLAGLAGWLHVCRRQYATGILFLLCLILCLSASVLRTVHRSQQQQVQVYALRRQSAIGFVDGQDLYLYRPGSAPGRAGSLPAAPESLPAAPGSLPAVPESLPAEGAGLSIPYELQGLAGHYRIQAFSRADRRIFRRQVDCGGLGLEYLVFAGQRVLLLRAWPGQRCRVQLPRCDMIVIMNNALPDPTFFSRIPPGVILVMDASNAPWTRREAAGLASRYGIDYHDVLLDGCFLSAHPPPP